MCTCPPHTPVLYWMADPLAESGKVRILQDRESHAGCEASSSAAFEYEFGALERLDNPVTETYLNLMYVSGLVHHAFSLTWGGLAGILPWAQRCLPYKFSYRMRGSTSRMGQ
jgi:hypothetical protein